MVCLHKARKTKTIGPRLVCLTTELQQKHYNLRIDSLPAQYRNADLMISEIHGDSLTNGGIPRGHIVVIAKGEAVSSGDLVAFTESEQLFVRYVFFGPGGWARFQSADRENYDDMIHSPGEFEIIGLVIHAEPYGPQLKME